MHGQGDDDDRATPMRKINGPLGDLWRKRHQTLQTDHGGPSAMQLLESTDFEHGPWIEMCQYMDLNPTEGVINGGIDLSRLRMNTEQIAAGFQTSGIVEEDLLVLIQSAKYVDEEIIATFHDPLGSIDGYFHRDVVDAIGIALVKGTGLVLRNVTVFMPVERRQQYLNICAGNIVHLFPATDAFDEDVAAFHRDQGDVIEVLEDSSLAATTSADLALMTQRQVIQRSSKAPAPLPEASKPKGGKPKGKWAWKSFKPQSKKPTGASPAVSITSSENVSPAPVPLKPLLPVKRTLPMASPPSVPPFDRPGTQEDETGIEMTLPEDFDVDFVMPARRVVTFTQASAADLLNDALEDDDW
ncbi:hypothetical protein SDRG_00666 [Saprolegnia diclina VS20]|uniref:Homologous recombination OB-fold protein OB-fold domain-containing protein n=1 Tax=Saprolegnia diclina (strain VS20) TaxID=1156394 RepID=T0R4A2_SAPDV|nr:hypothetical protein SDRG_00666 [Saprolegnia diclina VS20]EQC41806.1 hypothetical protein SDRG_00666 [Saprolegnia diclina VS20]|eukprot:XP_008604375.1 hypothetical protein SDRG_00666 [Saprolegnia diclina VS20]